MAITKESIDHAVSRIVELTHPLRVILFGSAVRGEIDPDSDVDFLIVVPEGMPPLETAQDLYCSLPDVKFPIDLLVVTPSFLQRHADNIGMIYRTILREGVEVYAA